MRLMQLKGHMLFILNKILCKVINKTRTAVESNYYSIYTLQMIHAMILYVDL